MSSDEQELPSDQAETMALLLSGLHDQNLNPKPTNVRIMSTYVNGSVSQRLQLVLSQCKTEDDIDDEMWDDFEIHRRSAETYLHKYLDALDRAHKERRGHVWEVDELDDEETPVPRDMALRQSPSDAEAQLREQCRLKIYHDNLERHVLAMHETLGFLKDRSEPLTCKRASHVGAASSIVIATTSSFLLKDSHPAFSPYIWAAALGGMAYGYYGTASAWLQTRTISWCQESLEHFLRRLKRGEMMEDDREGFRRVVFKAITLLSK